MIETELKITLDAEAEARLRRSPQRAALQLAPARNASLISVYVDTPEHRLADAGIALRLRRSGRRWVQTVKRRRSDATGLFANQEIECPAPGGRLVLGGPDPEGVYAAIVRAADGAALAPVFEIRVRRTTIRLRAPGGGEVELAIDRGEIVAGERRAAIREAELELVAGDVGAVFEVARLLFATGPVRFAEANKSARGYALARTGVADRHTGARQAGTAEFRDDAGVETVARDLFRDCFAQIAANMVIVADREQEEGAHQLRVGLRRLRTALKMFAPTLGGTAAEPLSDQARQLGRVVSALRDLDVLIGDVRRTAELGLDAAARDRLVAALDARRAAVRTEVRAALAAPEAVGFLFDLGAFIEARGWLAPGDYSQTARLAETIEAVAPAILDKRRRKAMKRGKHIDQLDHAALHGVRKQLKKLRYAAEMLSPIYPRRKVEVYLDALKKSQDAFGSLTDAAMAAGWLTGPSAPGPDDPEVQRATGWVLGGLAVRVGDDRPEIFDRWRRLVKAPPFWT